MRTRSRSLALAAVATATALLLTSCGGGSGDGGPGGVVGTDQQEQGVNDINPVPRDQLRDGGDLRWPLDAIPDNFNPNHVDGNLLENTEVVTALLPAAFVAAADGTVELNEHYYTSIELTSETPQVITYTLRPEATWDDGTPITWRDLQAQWQALNGTDPAYLPASTSGYESVSSVEQGTDEKQAVVTFSEPFAEWQALFNQLLPASTNSDPDAFNTGWQARPGTTAGPFRLEAVDATAQTITLVRNEKWWDAPAKLDRIIYRVTDRGALADALANNEIDFYAIGSDVNLFARGQAVQGAEIRQAVEAQYNHITFNGAGILAEPELRRALAKGIDRQAIARALIGQIVPETTPLGSYLFSQGQANYVDHSGAIAYDPAAAAAALDALGWVSPGPGQVRAKDGQPLTIRYVTTAGNPISERITQLTQSQLTALGVGVEVIPAASADLFDQYVTPGNFDLIGFAYASSIFPIVGTEAVYTTDGASNVSNIGTPEIDQLYVQANAELDEAARIALAQRIDELIWEQLPQLPLYQSTGAYAVRSTLANFGAAGSQTYDYADIGFVG
jgi:peptide/nickel transport system substrate-binding protein